MDDKLTILWTTGSEVTSTKMMLMYAINSKINGWWNEVNLVIWGESAGLVAENKKVQAHLQDAIDAGTHVEACRACADQLQVTETLAKLGVDVKYYG